MLQETESRLEAARVLRRSSDPSDSAYLLELLGFELLLKLLLEEHTGQPAPWHHRYEQLFALLPLPIQEQVLQLAGERIGPSGLSTEPSAVLKDLGDNFAALRYPYQKYAGLSEQQYSQLGARWVAAGSPTSAATFRYHPEELFGLIWAAKQVAGC